MEPRFELIKGRMHCFSDAGERWGCPCCCWWPVSVRSCKVCGEPRDVPKKKQLVPSSSALNVEPD